MMEMVLRLCMLVLVSSAVSQITTEAESEEIQEPKENSHDFGQNLDRSDEWFFVKSDRKHADNDPYLIDPNDFNRILPAQKYINPVFDVDKRSPTFPPKPTKPSLLTTQATELLEDGDVSSGSGSGWINDDETDVSGASGQFMDDAITLSNFTVDGNSVDATTGSGLTTHPGFSFACDGGSCRFGGVCDPRVDSVQCLCNLSCTVLNVSHGLVCGSDRRIYKSHCEMRVRSCETQALITSAPFQLCFGNSIDSQITKCEEKIKHKSYWSPWSVWIRSGNKDFRIRHCQKNSAPGSKGRFCSGRLVETRACPEARGKLCQGKNDSVEYEKLYKCRGIDIMDLAGADKLYMGGMNYEKCWFSLLDTKSSNYKYHRWSHTKLLTKGSYREWCQNRKRLLPFLSAAEHCHQTLNHYCHIAAKCKYRYGRERQKSDDMSNNCWKRFTIAGRLPTSIAAMRSTALLCQRFSRRSQLSTTYGSRDVYYATMYDTRRRVPAYSLAVLESISDVGWPAVPSLMERGLVNDGRFESWLYSSTEKGLLHESEVDKDLKGNSCHLSENQALDSDYLHSSMRAGPLITPNLVGCSPAAKISTRALTNTAPMYASQYYAWLRAMEAVRDYAEVSCGIPVDKNRHGVYCNAGQGGGRRQSKMYLVAGAVPTRDTVEVIGNEVNIPSLFWLAGCCLRGDGNITSFALYMRNSPDFPVKKLPVADIEIVLAEMYKPTKPVNIKLFPGRRNACRRSDNNDIDNLHIQAVASRY